MADPPHYDWPLGAVVPGHFDPGIVAASFFASLCGCYLTVEFLHRRITALGSLRSWLETLGCAIAMGLVGIWCMHFVGNRAIVMGDGDPTIQLVYTPCYTTLSVFLPVIGLTIAFSAAEVTTRSKLVHGILLLCTGLFAGLSIVGMHYIGNLAIVNYRMTYAIRYLVASIIIAVGDCMLVLVLFYVWRDKWINSWYKRLACGVTLAGGVAAMHFTASTQCTYILKRYSDQHDIHARNTQVQAAGLLCGITAVATLVVLLVINFKSSLFRRRAQAVSLACAIFDAQGRLMVTSEGFLPMRKLIDKYQYVSSEEEFDTAHPVFHWMLRVSYKWNSIIYHIPKMRSHLKMYAGIPTEDGHKAGRESKSKSDIAADFSIIFRERFCVAAASLATSLHLPIDRVGYLYDKVIDTGTLTPRKSSNYRLNDLEKQISTVQPFGKGQLLILTQCLDRVEADKLLNIGFRFASVQQVSRTIAEVMNIPSYTFDHLVTDMHRYIGQISSVAKFGTWLGCFAMIPKLGRKGFDVLVDSADESRLPSTPLLPCAPAQWQLEFLIRFDGLRSSVLLELLRAREGTYFSRTPAEKQFAALLAKGIETLSEQIPSEWFDEARFHCKALQIRQANMPNCQAGVTTVFAFCVMADIHITLAEHPFVTRVPLGLFDTVQQSCRPKTGHSTLAAEIHFEFGPAWAKRSTTNKPAEFRKRPRSWITSRSSSQVFTRRSLKRHTKAYRRFLQVPKLPFMRRSSVARDAMRPCESWGGILINSETIVEMGDGSLSMHAQPIAGLGIGTDVFVSTGALQPEETLVGHLSAVTRALFFSSKLGQ